MQVKSTAREPGKGWIARFKARFVGRKLWKRPRRKDLVWPDLSDLIVDDLNMDSDELSKNAVLPHAETTPRGTLLH